MNKVQWLEHVFGVYQKPGNWGDVGGVYIFAGLTPENRWRPYYMGQTDSFRNRIPDHERWAEAVRAGATHVHAMAEPREDQRLTIEMELVRTFRPRLNTHHVR